MTTSVEFTLGAESVTVPLDIQTGDETILTGDIGGLIAAGTTARLRGNCRLVADLHVRGTLLCDESGVDLDGQNLFDIHTHDGTLNLVGTEKTAWARWGDVVAGWQIGDRLAVAPTKAGVYIPTEITWQGSWTATPRPANSLDRTLVDGSVAKPEVANLSQTVTLRNLKRIMLHEATAPNQQTLKWIKVLDCGEAGVLGMYPVHFHQLYDNSRGSVVEGVVVEGGRNHAFVPHGSHGISFPNCVAYNTTGVAFWWDRPIPSQSPPHTGNDSDDIAWDDCLSMWSKPSTMAGENGGLAGFWLGAGKNVSCVGSVATCVPVSGNDQRAGFTWPENANRIPWDFRNCVGHNLGDNAIFVWQNDDDPHFVEDFVAYNCGDTGIAHGAYVNQYRYSRLVLDNVGFAVKQNAKTRHNQPDFLIFEDIITNGGLRVAHHNSDHMSPNFFRRCGFTHVVYLGETSNGSYNRYEDCGLVPADFDMTGAAAVTIAEIYEGGVLMHRWQSGVWS